MAFHVISRGQRYPLLKNMPGTNGWQFNYIEGCHHLEGFLDSPTSSEVAAMDHGRSEFALVTYKDVIALAFRFSPMDWQDAIYSWHRVPSNMRTLPGKESARIILTAILVDRLTGIVASNIRVVTWSLGFSMAMRDAISDQAARPYPGHKAHQDQIEELYLRYPHSRNLAAAAPCRCAGGS